MQQTRLDRWLRETFVLETHVLSISQPPYVPRRVKLETLEITLKNRFRYKMVIRKMRDLEKVLQTLTDANQTFTTKVLPRKTWCRGLFDDPEGKSFTYRVLWLGIILCGVVSAVLFIPWEKATVFLDAFNFLRQYM